MRPSPLMPTRRHATALLACGLALLTAGPAQAQDYPAKPITLVVGYPPGGSTDRHEATETRAA